jgi:hypothetical protein
MVGRLDYLVEGVVRELAKNFVSMGPFMVRDFFDKN